VLCASSFVICCQQSAMDCNNVPTLTGTVCQSVGFAKTPAGMNGVYRSTLTGGYNQYIEGAEDTALLGGYKGNIYVTVGSVLAGGYNNYIGNAGEFAVIPGGRFNCIGGGSNVLVAGGYSKSYYTATVTLGASRTSAGAQRTTVEELVKVSGAFAIPHPDPAKRDTHQLRHSFVESPTAGDNMYRYRVSAADCHAAISLPDYFRFLNRDVQVHVQPSGHTARAYASVSSDCTTVELFSEGDGNYDLLVMGTRNDAFATRSWRGAERIIENE